LPKAAEQGDTGAAGTGAGASARAAVAGGPGYG